MPTWPDALDSIETVFQTPHDERSFFNLPMLDDKVLALASVLSKDTKDVQRLAGALSRLGARRQNLSRLHDAGKGILSTTTPRQIEAAISESEVDFPGEIRVDLGGLNATMGSVSSRTRGLHNAKMVMPSEEVAIANWGYLQKYMHRHDNQGMPVGPIGHIHSLRRDGRDGILLYVSPPRGKSDDLSSGKDRWWVEATKLPPARVLELAQAYYKPKIAALRNSRHTERMQTLKRRRIRMVITVTPTDLMRSLTKLLGRGKVGHQDEWARLCVTWNLAIGFTR
jgi:hypothetical protein